MLDAFVRNKWKILTLHSEAFITLPLCLVWVELQRRNSVKILLIQKLKGNRNGSIETHRIVLHILVTFFRQNLVLWEAWKLTTCLRIIVYVCPCQIEPHFSFTLFNLKSSIFFKQNPIFVAIYFVLYCKAIFIVHEKISCCFCKSAHNNMPK